jgi:hypothetical protein
MKPKSGSGSRSNNSESYSRPNSSSSNSRSISSSLNSRLSLWDLKEGCIRMGNAKIQRRKNVLSGGAWGRPTLAVAAATSASTSELPDCASDCAHAAEGFALVELLIEFALEEVVVELASLTLGSEVLSYLDQSSNCKMQRQDILSGGAWGRSALAVAAATSASTSELPDSSFDCAHAAEGLALVELLIKFALEEVIVEFASPEARRCQDKSITVRCGEKKYHTQWGCLGQTRLGGGFHLCFHLGTS